MCKQHHLCDLVAILQRDCQSKADLFSAQGDTQAARTERARIIKQLHRHQSCLMPIMQICIAKKRCHDTRSVPGNALPDVRVKCCSSRCRSVDSCALTTLVHCRAGATSVIGAEMSQHMCVVGAETVVMNGYAAQCILVNKDVRRMDVVQKPDGTPPDMPVKADVLIFEVRGALRSSCD